MSAVARRLARILDFVLPPIFVLVSFVRPSFSQTTVGTGSIVGAVSETIFWMRFTHIRPARSLCATKVGEHKDDSWEAFEPTVLQATVYLSRRP
jgi:hypothetical protein